jgi:tetratricopeptide (TPR) repeat protein
MDVTRRSAKQLSVAMDHYRAGCLIEAERLYRLVCAADKGNAGARHLLGVVAHQLGRHDAVALIGRAVALNPDFAEAQNDHGVTMAATGKFGEASACFAKAVRLEPDYAEACDNLARALRRLGRPRRNSAGSRGRSAARPATNSLVRAIAVMSHAAIVVRSLIAVWVRVHVSGVTELAAVGSPSFGRSEAAKRQRHLGRDGRRRWHLAIFAIIGNRRMACQRGEGNYRDPKH